MLIMQFKAFRLEKHFGSTSEAQELVKESGSVFPQPRMHVLICYERADVANL